MRLFIAIDLGEDIIRRITKIEDELKRKDVDVKFVEPENLHLTLKFLGEVSENQLDVIKKETEMAVSGFSEFQISIEGCGYFGNPNYIRVLWIGVNKGREKLIDIIDMLNKSLESVRRDEYKPNPHLTIGRVRSGKNREFLLHEVESLEHVKLGEINVKEIKLKESVLSRKGPVYNDIKIFKLKQSA